MFKSVLAEVGRQVRLTSRLRILLACGSVFLVGCPRADAPFWPFLSPCTNNPCDNELACDGLERCTYDSNFDPVCIDGTPIECLEAVTFCTEPDGACVRPCDGADCSDQEELDAGSDPDDPDDVPE